MYHKFHPVPCAMRVSAASPNIQILGHFGHTEETVCPLAGHTCPWFSHTLLLPSLGPVLWTVFTPGRPLLRAHVGFVLWELVHISVRDSQGRARAQGAGRVTPQLPFLRATGRHLAFLSRFCSLGLGGASWLLPLQSGPQLLNLSI